MERVIIFDMDGVLINSEALHYQLWRQVFAENGVEIDFDHYKGCIGSRDDVLMELIYCGYGVDFRQRSDLLERFEELKRQYIDEKGVPEIPGVRETLQALREQGYRMAVASSSPQAYIELCTAKIGIAAYFQVLFSGERVAHPKPAPDVFLAAARAMGVSPEGCVVVEDSHNGSRAAKAAGMRCIGFVNPDSGDQDLSAADVLIHQFTELLEVI